MGSTRVFWYTALLSEIDGESGNPDISSNAQVCLRGLGCAIK